MSEQSNNQQPAAAPIDIEPRNVEGMTRAEFEQRLRISYQHDNVRAHVNAESGFALTAEQERDIAERVEQNYPAQGTFECPICGKDEPHEHSSAEVAQHRIKQRHPAPAPADERAVWGRARESLAVAMAGFASRSGSRDFNAALSVLDAITEPGLPLSWLRTARASSANETGAEGATWRELCRRLYVELFHCDQQMRSTRDEDGEPHWTQSSVVRDVLADAKAALDGAPAQAAEPVAIGEYDLNTSAGGRGYIAEFFEKRLRRHDFGRYINERLAADFACVLAQYLRDQDAAPKPPAQADALPEIEPPQAGGNKGRLPALARTREGGNLYSLGYNRGLKKGRDEAAQANGRERLTDERIDEIARPFAGLGGIEDYRAFARALFAAHPGQPEPADCGETLPGEYTNADDLIASLREPEPHAEVTEEQPSLTNPLTPYGMLCRALRIVAGTTLMDMAQHLGRGPAELSSIEFGRKPVRDADIVDAAHFFACVGIQSTTHALTIAARAGCDHADQA